MIYFFLWVYFFDHEVHTFLKSVQITFLVEFLYTHFFIKTYFIHYFLYGLFIVYSSITNVVEKNGIKTFA